MSEHKEVNLLLVDDEPDILEFLSYNLIKEGYLVHTAANGKEAIVKAGQIMPDLIVLDIMMPGMDGFQVCKELRLDARYDDTIIVFLTARGEDYTQISALDRGGDDFIQKPVRVNVFVSRLKALLRRKLKSSAIEQAVTSEYGPFIIDYDQHIVTKDGQPIELARKEFNLFSLLISKPGKVFKRLEILNSVWGSDVIVGSRTIDVHIRKLREKLGDKVIKTVKGVGYKINI
ncbi:UNVERIFIED_CONTAM: hypothetical protein GTU68_066957 [Idotea baltica]|nr:hypothetical protein [Idotea baltica]